MSSTESDKPADGEPSPPTDSEASPEDAAEDDSSPVTSSAPKTSRKSSAAKALLLGLLVALILGEGFARYRHAHPGPASKDEGPPAGMFHNDPVTGFHLSPDYHLEAERFRTNSMGHRDRARKAGPASEGTIRVVVCGDSLPTGVGVDDEQTMTRLLEDALGELLGEGKVEVWNLGIPHFGTQQAMLHVLDEWEEIQPDVVLLALFEGNDPLDDIQGPAFHKVVDGRIARPGWAPRAGDPYNGQRSELNRPSLAHHLPGDDLLHRYSYLYRLVLRMVDQLRFSVADVVPEGMQPFDYEAFGTVAWFYLVPEPTKITGAWEITTDVVRRFRIAVEERGSYFGLIDVPTKIDIHPEDLPIALEEGWEFSHPEDQGMSFDAHQVARRVEGLAAAAEVRMLALRPPLIEAAGRGERLYYLDDSHWTAGGQRVAASQVGLFLSNMGWIPTIDSDALERMLLARIPRDSYPVEFETDFKEEGPDGKGGEKGEHSEIPPRLGEPNTLVSVLPDPPDGWTLQSESVAKEALVPPREDVIVSRASRTYSHGDGRTATLAVMDSGGQPEVDAWWAGMQPARIRLGPVPPGPRPSTARIAVVLEGDGFELIEAVDAAALAKVEAELAPTSPPKVHPTMVVGPLPPPVDIRQRLNGPPALNAALPLAPPGWQVLDIMPMYRPHLLHDHGRALPDEIAARLDVTSELYEDEDIWTAQTKQWIRGPGGSFALVIQDTGWNRDLITSREGRIHDTWSGTGEPIVDERNREVTFRRWEGDGFRGFRSCIVSQGLCKVVAPLQKLPTPGAPPARYNVILMGPPDAPDSVYAELVSAIRVDNLPR